MVDTKIKRGKRNGTFAYIPAFLCKKFDFQNGEIVDIDTDGTRIILTKKIVD
jgi:antitoxin component of MazEF toxin-antitoxin module